MSKKIKYVVHMADIHIRNIKLHAEYKEVFVTLISDLKTLLADCDREEIRILIAGDLVHQKITITNELMMLGTWFLKELEAIGNVVLIAGNHDLLENNKGRMDSITPMVELLGDKEIAYYKESKCYEDGNIVWCVYSIFEENARPDIESAKLEYGRDKTYIGLFHAPVENAKTDIGYEIDHGASLEIFEGCDIVMLGDIHKRSVFNHKGIPIAYPSSLIQQNFGENVSKHGFLVWNLEDNSYTEHDVVNNHGYYQFKITSSDDVENNTEKITNL